jgi:uncharacterized BrkB/YihY/UPF0761 family membrane protein
MSKNVDIINPFAIISGSLSFVAGLAWNEAIQSSISEYYPADVKKSVIAKYTYALIITIIILLLIFIIKNLNDAAVVIKSAVTSYEENKRISNKYLS